MEKKQGLHAGHRDRVRDRFLDEGLERFQDHQVLEMLLFYGVPRKDTNEIAHKLLNHCGSLSGVMDAPLQMLYDCGLSKSAAVLIKMIPSLCARYYNDRYNNDKDTSTNCDQIGERIMKHFIGAVEEQVVLLLMDHREKIIFCDVVSKGTLSASEVNIKKILRTAVTYKASAAILAHNHPSGIPLPSSQDVTVTKLLKNALRAIGVVLMDHLIVADMKYNAMSEMPEWEELFF